MYKVLPTLKPIVTSQQPLFYASTNRNSSLFYPPSLMQKEINLAAGIEEALNKWGNIENKGITPKKVSRKKKRRKRGYDKPQVQNDTDMRTDLKVPDYFLSKSLDYSGDELTKFKETLGYLQREYKDFLTKYGLNNIEKIYTHLKYIKNENGEYYYIDDVRKLYQIGIPYITTTDFESDTNALLKKITSFTESEPACRVMLGDFKASFTTGCFVKKISDMFDTLSIIKPLYAKIQNMPNSSVSLTIDKHKIRSDRKGIHSITADNIYKDTVLATWNIFTYVHNHEPETIHGEDDHEISVEKKLSNLESFFSEIRFRHGKNKELCLVKIWKSIETLEEELTKRSDNLIQSGGDQSKDDVMRKIKKFKRRLLSSDMVKRPKGLNGQGEGTSHIVNTASSSWTPLIWLVCIGVGGLVCAAVAASGFGRSTASKDRISKDVERDPFTNSSFVLSPGKR